MTDTFFILWFMIIFVLHGASYEVFTNDHFVKKLSKYCVKSIAVVAFAATLFLFLPFDNKYLSLLAAGVATLGYVAGFGKYAKIMLEQPFDAGRKQALRYIVTPLRKLFSITEDSLNHARLFLFVKGFIASLPMGGVVFASAYLAAMELKRLLVLKLKVNERVSHFFFEVTTGAAFGLNLYLLYTII